MHNNCNGKKKERVIRSRMYYDVISRVISFRSTSLGDTYFLCVFLLRSAILLCSGLACWMCFVSIHREHWTWKSWNFFTITWIALALLVGFQFELLLFLLTAWAHVTLINKPFQWFRSMFYFTLPYITRSLLFSTRKWFSTITNKKNNRSINHVAIEIGNDGNWLGSDRKVNRFVSNFGHLII